MTYLGSLGFHPPISLPPVERVYLDANVLIRAKWPQLSQTMRTALGTASRLSTPVVLLQTVERELRAHSLREFQKSVDALTAKARALNANCESVGLVASASSPSPDEFAAAYDTTVEETVRDFLLERSCPTLRPSDELFQMAIERQKPFADEGKNFQDVVICLSAVDDLISSGSRTAAFVTRDRIFEQQLLDHICRPHAITMKLFASEVSLTDDLRRSLQEQADREWREDEELAKNAVDAHRSALQFYIERNLEVPTRLGWSKRILGIKRIEIADILRVETPAPWARPSGEPITITTQVSIRIHATVRRPSPQRYEAEVLKVGATPERLADRMTRPLYTETDELLERTVNIEIKARFESAQYVDLQPASVTLTTRAPIAPASITVPILPTVPKLGL